MKQPDDLLSADENDQTRISKLDDMGRRIPRMHRLSQLTLTSIDFFAQRSRPYGQFHVAAQGRALIKTIFSSTHCVMTV
jgi:hypothetical protein